VGDDDDDAKELLVVGEEIGETYGEAE